MEKIKRTESTNIITNYSENSIKEDDIKNIKNMRIYGFENSMDVARSIFGSIHENLLRGDLIFAYRSTASSNKTTLYQIVVVNDLNPYTGEKTNRFSISTITSTYSSYIPHMPIDYLSEVVKDLEDGKADKKIIETFKVIIEDLSAELENIERGK